MSTWALGTLLLGLASPAVAAEPDTELSRVSLTAACELGDMESCTNLGFALMTGQDGAADPAAAAVRYQQACAGGDAVGCTNLGLMAQAGEGIAQDDAQAQELFERSCGQGDAAGCTQLGLLFEGGAVAGSAWQVCRPAALMRSAMGNP